MPLSHSLGRQVVQKRLHSILDVFTEKLKTVVPEGWSNSNPNMSWVTYFGSLSNANENATSLVGNLSKGDSPSILNFFLSSYFIVLIFLGVVVNRIQAIVTPRTSQPIPLSTKFAIRSPSIYLLLKSIITIITTTYGWRDYIHHIILDILDADKGTTGTDALWLSFKAMSCVTVIETFCSCLERRPSPQEQPISLFEWALLLYYTSSGSEIYIVVLLQLLQLLTLQIVYLHPQGPNYRLIPTAFFGILGLVHFAYALWTRSQTYPALQALARMPELLVVIIIIISVTIHTAATWAGDFRARRIFVPQSLPGLHEDYAVAIFKVGSACLEATRGVGLRNECDAITVPLGTIFDTKLGKERRASFLGGVNTTIVGCVESEEGFGNEIPDEVIGNDDDEERPSYPQIRFGMMREFCGGFWQSCKWFLGGCWNFVGGILRRDVQLFGKDGILAKRKRRIIEEITESEPEEDLDYVLYQRFLTDEYTFVNEFGDELEDENDGSFVPGNQSDNEEDDSSDGESLEDLSDDINAITELYDLATEVREQEFSSLSVGADPFFSSPQASSSFLSLFITHYLHTNTLTRNQFFAIRSAAMSTSSSFSSSSALTTFPSLLNPLPSQEESEIGPLANFVQQTRTVNATIASSSKRPPQYQPSPALCVVCQCEPREILLRPCCCLILCNDCRENMAARRFKNCPCCRRKVEGFSRVYMP